MINGEFGFLGMALHNTWSPHPPCEHYCLCAQTSGRIHTPKPVPNEPIRPALLDSCALSPSRPLSPVLVTATTTQTHQIPSNLKSVPLPWVPLASPHLGSPAKETWLKG